jgi:hypothetical protein
LAAGDLCVVDGSAGLGAGLPDGRGFVRLSVIDAKGRVDRVTVRLR